MSSKVSDPSTKMELADQCVAVDLTPHNTDLLKRAIDLHLVGNDGSNERFKTDQGYRERAEMGYRAEIAVAQYYDLIPTIDYRPPGVGDSGHDFRAEINGEVLTIDVKATRVLLPELFLTRERSYSDKYNTPDKYLLCSHRLTENDDTTHLVGWCGFEDIAKDCNKDVVNGNPVWKLNWRNLDSVPDSSEVTSLPRGERELWAAADRSNTGATEDEIEKCLQILS